MIISYSNGLDSLTMLYYMNYGCFNSTYSEVKSRWMTTPQSAIVLAGVSSNICMLGLDDVKYTKLFVESERGIKLNTLMRFKYIRYSNIHDIKLSEFEFVTNSIFITRMNTSKNSPNWNTVHQEVSNNRYSWGIPYYILPSMIHMINDDESIIFGSLLGEDFALFNEKDACQNSFNGFLNSGLGESFGRFDYKYDVEFSLPLGTFDKFMVWKLYKEIVPQGIKISEKVGLPDGSMPYMYGENEKVELHKRIDNSYNNGECITSHKHGARGSQVLMDLENGFKHLDEYKKIDEQIFAIVLKFIHYRDTELNDIDKAALKNDLLERLDRLKSTIPDYLYNNTINETIKHNLEKIKKYIK